MMMGMRFIPAMFVVVLVLQYKPTDGCDMVMSKHSSPIAMDLFKFLVDTPW